MNDSSCPQHGVALVERSVKVLSKEQEWCGTWFECPLPYCRHSKLIPSPELIEQLAAQRQALKDRQHGV